MYCSNCGAQNPDGATFCTNCGSSLSPQSASVQASAVSATPISVETETMRKKATTAMILGIIACVVAWYPVISIAAIILGAMAISKAKQVKAYYETIAQQRPGTALAGKITGIVGLVGGIIMTVVYLAYFAVIVLVASNYCGSFTWEGIDIDIPTAF